MSGDAPTLESDSKAPAKERLVHMLGMTGQKVTYEQARALLDHPDTAVRLKLATRWPWCQRRCCAAPCGCSSRSARSRST